MNGKAIRIVAALAALALAPAVALAGEKININTADEATLMKLPEMNQARAKAILNYRASQGEFIQIEEIELVPQVKQILPKIKDLIVLE